MHDNGLSAIAVGCGNHLEVCFILILYDFIFGVYNFVIILLLTLTSVQILRLSGCDGVTGKGLQSLAKHCTRLHTLELVGCLLVGDKDVGAFKKGNWIETLKQLSISGCKEVTDAGVLKISESVGPNLSILNISGCDSTDTGAAHIVQYCQQLRELDISNCVEVSDEAVDILVKGISCLTTLKLDGNPRIHAKTVASYVANKQVTVLCLIHESLSLVHVPYVLISSYCMESLPRDG